MDKKLYITPETDLHTFIMKDIVATYEEFEYSDSEIENDRGQ